LRDGELVYDGDIADVSEATFREIYGRSVTPDDLLEGADL
jgi:ABC-type phosphate/phosphonate transport system ATPase subunit